MAEGLPGALRVYAEQLPNVLSVPNLARVLRESAEEIDSLVARLTTAETERDQWKGAAEFQPSSWADLHSKEHDARLAAEARVEALSEALRDLLASVDEDAGRSVSIYTMERARAALACPPQQTGEK